MIACDLPHLASASLIWQEDDAILALHVYDRTVSHSTLISYSCIPMSSLRTGWRVVRLRSPTGSRLALGSLLIHIRKEVRKGTPNMKKRPPQGLMGIRGVPQPGGRSSKPAKGNPNIGEPVRRATINPNIGEPVRRATIDPKMHSPYSV